MVREELDITDNFPKISEGEHIFEIYEVSPRIETLKSHYRSWKFNTFINGEIQQVKVNLFPWQAKDLLLAVGYKEGEDEVIEQGIRQIKKTKTIIWDDEEVIGKKFSAVLSYQKNKDTGKEFPRLAMFQSVNSEVSTEDIPF